jgi:hypothetical protein
MNKSNKIDKKKTQSIRKTKLDRLEEKEWAAEQAAIEQWRDEKRGLYPNLVDIAN